MVQIFYSGADGCNFSFQKNNLPPSAQDNELAFFLDLLAKNKMLTNQRSSEGEMCSGWSHYGCRFGGIPFSLDYDQYWDCVHFSADSSDNAHRVADRLKALIEAEAAEKRK